MLHLPDETDVAIDMSEVATKAVHAAFLKARESRLPVVIAEGDQLIEVGPDNSRTVLKQLPPLQKPARRLLIIA
ncbi:hypothetical protein [Fibrella aquatilis]|uniref:Uncharacterized protein n=1 Tax=Fibrella aquatilis TaxID=2817059 RepID=A0A939G8N9_9BACT|nr:hypothetical protein [Fibrella aquatilis]MBO0933268.1 hypothetical protein [Fibrella aquatilis]